MEGHALVYAVPGQAEPDVQHPFGDCEVVYMVAREPGEGQEETGKAPRG